MTTVYSKPKCVQCEAVKRHLTNKKTDYEVVDVSLPENESAMNYIVSLGYTSVPVVVTGEDHFYGFNPDRLNAL